MTRAILVNPDIDHALYMIATNLDIQKVTRFPKSADVVFLFNYSHKVSAEDIARVPLGVINFHPAPLPQYRGRNGVAHAILNGEKEWSVTAHYIDADYDTGPIIKWASFPIQETDTAYTLWQRSQQAMRTLFQVVAEAVMQTDGKLPAKPQGESKAHYYPKNSLDEYLDCTNLAAFSLDSEQELGLVYRVRALTFPGKPKPYVTVSGHQYELTLKEDK